MDKWIKVIERLPSIGESVLVFGLGTMGVCYLYEGGSRLFWTTDSASGYECDLGWSSSVDGPYADITHWMPLPERPE